MSESVLYTTLAGEGEAEFTEKKSVFIGHAAPVKSEEEAQAFVKKYRNQYMDARHNVWAYLMKGEIVARYSDDGEPQGTAGVPVLDTIRKSGVTDAAVVVTRYFGGILLGAGGLVRAYSHTARLALEAARIITYEQYDVLELSCSYSDYQRYSAELPRFGAVIDDTVFTDRVTLSFAVKSTVTEGLFLRIREMSGGRDEAILRGKRFDYR
ncbi:MAG: YigZ family protein [Clostridia bacterium]|nr:YigZ family protein [Clostridia bacterium]MBQ2249414.1 YigZ family protein [Clostridia bacterium]MBQ5612237.1 YigZ family protein [Clostridia bacterium]MBQ5661593.1 YigZ family protein [Clostridia bacterium]MBQ5772806.1 YigZ family protein [Clostridia bacterium]